MSVNDVANGIVLVFEAIGLAVLSLGTLWAAVAFLKRLAARSDGHLAYRALRQELGRTILVGLEILVAADIIRTIAVEPSLENVAILGGIVLIRTFLSFSLETEVEGVLPWRRAG